MPELVADKITIKAPAKINLYLDVLGCREDGYHDIRSIVVPVSVYDEIDIEMTAGEISTVVTNGGLASAKALCSAKSEDNLVSRALKALKEETGYSGGAKINLRKKIPVGGGLGGGSSDTAAVLLAANDLWDSNLSDEELMKIGFKLGCDIPAMLHGGAVCMEGLGEQISPISVEKKCKTDGWWMVILNPGFEISTGDIYSRYSSSLTYEKIPFNTIVSSLEKGDVEKAASGLYNALQETVFAKYPIVKMFSEELKKAGAIGVLLSGSGASIFGLARDEDHANEIVNNMENVLEESIWIKVARTCPMV